MELDKQQEGSRVSVWRAMAKLYMVRDRYLSLRDPGEPWESGVLGMGEGDTDL